MKRQKKQTSQNVISARILAGLALLGLLVMLKNDKANANSNIGASLGVFYDTILISILVITWVISELRRYLKK